MAALPVNNTRRIWLDYSDGINTHSMMWRLHTAGTDAGALTGLHNFLTALAPELYELSIMGARASNVGSNVSFPLAWTGSATYGTGAMPLLSSPRELRYEGRSISGRRVHTSVFGYSGDTPGNYRIGITPSDTFDDALVVLIAQAALGNYRTIDATSPNMKNYVNIQNNSYWETAARG